MYTKKSHNSSRPHAKWGICVLGMMTIVIEIALILLNLCRDSLTEAPLFVAVLAAYGWLFGALLAMLGISAIVEEFLPSYHKVKQFKALKNYRKAVKSAVRESVRSNERKNNAIYKEFLKENPQYVA